MIQIDVTFIVVWYTVCRCRTLNCHKQVNSFSGQIAVQMINCR